MLLRLTSGNQFGMDKDLVQNLMQARELFSHVNIRGIHYFSGTRKKIEKICRELEQLDAFLLEAEEKTGCKAEEMEYGPGLFAACFEGEEDRAAQELAAICEKISAMRWKGKVTLEMGRAFTASCGYYLTGVRDTKKNNGVKLLYCGRRHPSAAIMTGRYAGCSVPGSGSARSTKMSLPGNGPYAAPCVPPMTS